MTYPKSDHFDGALFFNPEPAMRQMPGRRMNIFTFIKWRLQRNANNWSRWPQHVENKSYPPPAPDLPGITFIGHSSFLIRLPGINILTDPVFSKRCSPTQLAGPRRVRDPGIAIAGLPEIHLILLSHNHYDHTDLISLRKIRKRFPNAGIACMLGNTSFLAKNRLPGAVEFDWWETKSFAGATLTAVPARHFAARTLWDRNTTLWGGFVLEYRGQKIYFAGDTGYTKFFKEIAERCGPPDLALLPIGAYAPRWFMAPVHMNPEDAVDAFKDLGARRAIGMHFGTFQLTAEAIDAPVRELAAACEKAGITAFTALDVGESVNF